MVKNIASILASLILILSSALFETHYIRSEFDSLQSVLIVLYDKCEEKTATEEDGKGVQALWEQQKKTLHILIPHTAISAVDAWLSEARGYLHEGNYKEVLPKVRVLIDLCTNIPKAYYPTIENIL